VLTGRGRAGDCDVAAAQQLARAFGSDRLAEMKALRLCGDVGQCEQIALLLGLHALRDDDDPDIARKIDDSANRRRALRICGGTVYE
jgi:hypothetical protein